MVGRLARMRESSTTWPSSSGTLKSTRTKTFLPAGSKSRTVSLSMIVRRPWLQAGSDERDEVGDAAAVAPFVVVPGDDLHEVPAQRHGRGAVDDRRAAVATEVGRDERVVAHAEDAC